MSIEPEQLSSLVSRYAGPLTLYARQWCDDAAGHSPEDVVQEAFMQLARQSTVPYDPPAWLYRTVRNGALSARRSWWRRRKREHSTAAARPDWFQPTDDARLDAVAAVEALKSIGAECREIVTAHLWGELTFQQIAELTGLTVSTTHRRYREGLEQLRTRLEHPCTNKN
jgi:RNA polymerase sigma factor (sigma-70 family)